jgi:replicative DNA helicase
MITLEMTTGELSLLALSRFSGIARNRIRAAYVPSESVPLDTMQRAALDRAILRYQGLELKLRLHGASDRGRSVDEVLTAASRARYDAVFVDHLGMIGRDSSARELDSLAQAIHRLRGLSRGEVVKGYRPWVVATSQLNREIDKGDEERIPRLADFRGSSRIEHDADVAIGLQKRTTKEGAAISTLDAFVLKNRNGPCPAVLVFDANGETGLITERHHEDAQMQGED